MAAIELYSTPLFSDANLIHYYRFESNSNDSKGSDNGTDSSVTYIASQFNNGLKLAGSSGSKVQYAVPLLPTGAKSISFWFKDSTPVDLETPWGNGGWDGGANGTSMFNAADGKLHWICTRSAGGNAFELTSSANLCDGTRRLITLTWDGTTGSNAVKFYVNGSLDVQGTASFTENAPSSNFKFGQKASSTEYVSNAEIDDFAVFDDVLTPTEISNLYNGTWTSIKTINGLAKASVKTINGLAIASVKTINGLA